MQLTSVFLSVSALVLAFHSSNALAIVAKGSGMKQSAPLFQAHMSASVQQLSYATSTGVGASTNAQLSETESKARAPLLLKPVPGPNGMMSSTRRLTVTGSGSRNDVDAGSGTEDPCHGETFLSYISRLQGSFKAKWEKDLAAFFAASRRVPMMLVSTRHEICIVDNFLSHADKAAHNHTIVIAGLDVESNAFCSGRRNMMKGATLNCLDLSSWISGIRSGLSGIKNNNAGFMTCAYLKAVLAKPVLLSHAIQVAPHGILMIDADIVLHGNLPGYVHNHLVLGKTLMAGLEAGTYDLPNGGTIWAGKDSGNLMSKWVTSMMVDEKIAALGDQEFLQNLMAKMPNHDWLQTIPHKILGEEAEKGRLATHYNGVSNKILKMKKDGVWFPLQDACK